MSKKKQDFLLSSIYRNILFYQDMIQKNTNSIEKEYYVKLLNRERLWMDYVQEEQGISPDTNHTTPRTFTLEELATFNGEGGNPPYVAVNGIVYDLSSKPIWRQGNHFGLKAGKDLTAEFGRCHQGIITRLQQLPQVGTLIQ